LDEIKLKEGCLCPSCPHFQECLSAVKHLIGEIREYEENSEPLQKFKKELDKVVEDPLNLLFAYGGALLAEWIKKNYFPRKLRKQ